ncbi:SLC13 family permease [Pseudarthrobacter sp. J1738]|uniref:SLC13 family permease n=1 Tax=unclassified Pseudarthrobacter TaxID=2647000 RepID=UPI003D2DC2E5
MRPFLLPVLFLVLGLLCLVTGLLPAKSASELADRTVPVLTFVVAMTIVTELADDAGLFRWASSRMARLGRHSVVRLWLLSIGLASVITLFFSLDTTAVLVTPVVVLLALHAKIPPLPFALTTIWLANTVSLLLPVSNLSNLLAQQHTGLTPAAFAGLMWAPALVALLVPVLLLWVMFRKQLRGTYALASTDAAGDKLLLLAAAGVVVVLLPLLVSGLPVQWPALGAAVVLLVFYLWRRPHVLRISMLPWKPLMLTTGLFMVVETLHAQGLAELLLRQVIPGDGLAPLVQLAALGTGSANLANNLPAYLALEPAAGSPLRYAALLIGVNVGPLITPWASLATLLWHERLAVLGVRVRWSGFAVAGIVAVVITIPLAVFALWLSAGMPA